MTIRRGDRLKEWATKVAERRGPTLRRVWATGAMTALILFIAYNLTEVGWGQVWRSLPAAPTFYLSLLPNFLVMPVADIAIYRILLGPKRRIPVFVLLRKRSLNGIVLEYSGEAYFFIWARRHLDLEDNRILFHAVRDSNLLSAAAGLPMAWIMLSTVWAIGDIKTTLLLHVSPWAVGTLGTAPLVLATALLVGGRRVTAMTRRQIAATFMVHLLRCVVALALEFLSWWLSGALPSAVTCIEFVVFRLLLTRLPFLPNKDLVFLGVGVAAAGAMGLSQPKVAATLVVMAAVAQALDLIFVGLPWLIDHLRPRGTAEQSLN